MFTKTKIALAATLVLGTASLAAAQDSFDPNPANRYPAYNEPQATVPYRSAPVLEGRNVGRVPLQAPARAPRPYGSDNPSAGSPSLRIGL